MPSTAAYLRLTVSALMYATGERQADLAAGLGITQGQVSRKQGGSALWSLDDLDRLSVHYGIPVPDLLCGADHAVSRLPTARRAAHLGGSQTTITLG
ncbi:helix-turn-helix domain-containing protein [Streptomyces cinereoruber]|uniref:helix-turn-helix domain-containing protein n=1 Tax=Streptomyces cinereoruber TaxID=67260 RepID=UPI0036363D91